MKNYTIHSDYFCGNKISDYGLKNGYVDYRTLAKSFDAVLNNDIMSLTQDIGYWEQVNGMIDNSDEIEELEGQKEELEGLQCDLIREDKEDTQEYTDIQDKIDKIDEDINDLQEEQDNFPEVFQWLIIDDQGASLLQDCTDEVLYYNETLDMYLWGVTHYGTCWDYVLTDIKIVKNEEV